MLASLDRGALAAGVVGLLAVGAGVLVSRIGGAGHPAVYAVLVASGSAAVVLSIIQERRLTGPAVLTLVAQVTVADVAATIAIPFVLRPGKALNVAVGTVLIAVCLIGIFAFGRSLRGAQVVRALRRQGKRRRWVIDLRAALIVLFGLAWIAQRTGASVLIAGFGAGLLVAAVGGPKRLSTEVLGVAGGFFVPLFFVVLGAASTSVASRKIQQWSGWRLRWRRSPRRSTCSRRSSRASRLPPVCSPAPSSASHPRSWR